MRSNNCEQSLSAREVSVQSVPDGVDLCITSRCNLRCAYCGHFSGAGDVDRDLGLDEWVRFFDELHRNAIREVCFQGGEPLIREDFPDIVEAARELRIGYSVLTNGTLITDGIAAFLAQSGNCRLVQVSIDGSIPVTHDAFRGAGAFRRAMDGLKSLLKYRVPVTVRVTIHRRNVDDLENIAALLLDEIGLPEFSTNSASHFGLCRKNADQIQLTAHERSRAMRSLLKLSEKYDGRISASAGPLAEATHWTDMEDAKNSGRDGFPNGGFLRGCNGPMSRLAVRADGVLVPCVQLSHIELGTINRDDLRRVWRDHPELRRLRNRVTKSLTEFSYCRECEYVKYCSGNCPAVAYTMTGKDDQPSPDACLRRFKEAGGTLPPAGERKPLSRSEVLPTFPLSQLYFYLTAGCNLRCRHCWIEPEHSASGKEFPELDVELFRSILDQAQPLGLAGIKLTGGEPLLHSRIGDILDEVGKRGLRLGLETNGVLCTPEIAEALKACRDLFVSVSLDGTDAETHDWMRATRGSFEGALAGIRNLVGVGLSPQIIMSVGQRNRDQLGALVKLAESIGAGSVKFNMIQPTARGRKLHESGETLSIDELVQLGRWVETELAPRSAIPVFFSHPAAFTPLSRMLGQASDGCHRCSILGILGVLGDGSYALCGIGETIPELVFGHAAKDRLVDVWENNPILKEIRTGLPLRLEGVCGECLMKGFCLGSCLAQNYSSSRSLWAPYWYCAEARERGLFPESRLIPRGSATHGCAQGTPTGRVVLGRNDRT
jgi:SynChlorMet cassette radical SAM/SPASM protein ScmF/SynChlorMet cassette radical SAM/SPASM protein ScmE